MNVKYWKFYAFWSLIRTEEMTPLFPIFFINLPKMFCHVDIIL